MLTEWIKSLIAYFKRARQIMYRDVNGTPFSKRSVWLCHAVFLLMTGSVVWSLPNGLSREFIDYIKDIFAIFVGFFVTVLTFVFDKLDVEQVPSEKEMDDLPVDQRWSSQKCLRVTREHNYTVRFFYATGLIIIYSTVVLACLIPNIFWEEFFSIDWKGYVWVESYSVLTIDSLLLAAHLTFCLIYRFFIIFLSMKVFCFTLYTVSSLLQVLISKKKIDS